MYTYTCISSWSPRLRQPALERRTSVYTSAILQHCNKSRDELVARACVCVAGRGGRSRGPKTTDAVTASERARQGGGWRRCDRGLRRRVVSLRQARCLGQPATRRRCRTIGVYRSAESIGAGASPPRALEVPGPVRRPRVVCGSAETSSVPANHATTASITMGYRALPKFMARPFLDLHLHTSHPIACMYTAYCIVVRQPRPISQYNMAKSGRSRPQTGRPAVAQ